MTTHVRILRTTAAVLFATCIAAEACRDPSPIARSALVPTPRTITPRLVVSTGPDAVATVTMALDVGEGVDKVGSFTGTLSFDAASLEYLGEVAIADTTVRASNRQGATIRVAGASSSGIDASHLAAVRFRVLDTAGLGTMHFDFAELHGLSQANLRSLIRAPAGRMAP